jgi:mannitol-1-phosphate 5-dehydrogenase
MTIVIFGAGNIGRSFIGQLFGRAGYRVLFVDVDEVLVAELNRRGEYRVEVKGPRPEEIVVRGVAAINGRDAGRVAEALVEADLAATAVGQGALPHLFPVIAEGLRRRRAAGRPPLDLLICENLRHAAPAFAEGLRPHLPVDFPMEEYVGLVETSIGKMVPIMPEAVKQRDPLVIYAEAYNTLPVDAKAFRGAIPEVPGLDPKQNMAAHVDRKSFIHNLGHAACAYRGYAHDPSLQYVWQVVRIPELRAAAKAAMWESGRALMRRYPEEFTEESQEAHIEDLLERFGNEALGDTIFRVGRDLPRKLSRHDRIVGALLLDAAEGVPAPATIATLVAALSFRATDEHGRLYPADEEFARNFEARGVEWVLTEVCGLAEEAGIREAVARLSS